MYVTSKPQEKETQQSTEKESVLTISEENLKKVYRGLQIEPIPPKLSEDEIKSDPRNLDIALESPSFIPFSTKGIIKSPWYSYYYLFKNIKKTRSNFLIYPYEFISKNETGEETDYSEGGYFDIKPGNKTEDTSFTYLKQNTTVEIKKTKAVYDADIAILKFEVKSPNGEGTIDMFTESENFCSLFTTSYSKANSCLRGKEEYEKAKAENIHKTYVVYIDSEDIKNGILKNEVDGSNNFGLLIIGDHSLDSTDAIIEALGDSGVENIKNYIKMGGNVIVSGKSGYFLEKWGIVKEGTYNTKYTLNTKNSNNEIKLEDKAETNDDTSFEKRMLTTNIQSRLYVTSTYPMTSDNENEFEVIINYNSNDNSLLKKDMDGFTSEMDESTNSFLPAILLKKYEKGRIVLFNANAGYKLSYANAVLNTYILAISRNVTFDYYVNFGEDLDLPIPGGEGGIQLSAKVDFLNTFGGDEYAELYLAFPNNVTPASTEGFDIIENDLKTEFPNLIYNDSVINTSFYVRFNSSKVDAFQKKTFKISLEILDQSVTIKGTDILLFYPVLKLNSNGVEEVIDTGGLKVNAGLGAILRGSLNPDPSSCYPFPGKGYPVDNILQLENKENTLAKEVIYYAVIPLISPLMDGVNQQFVAEGIYFDESYYRRHVLHKDKMVGNFSVHWKLENESSEYYLEPQAEFIDFKELSGKSVIMAADWDQPVKINKRLRASYNASTLTDDLVKTETLDVVNAQYSTTINSSEILLEQIYFENADRFFEVGTQRLMPFVDITTESGFAYFNSQGLFTNETDKDPDNDKIGKTKFFFSRDDIYFYDSKDYQNPENVNSSVVISIDKFQRPPEEKKGAKLGDKRTYVMNPGHFDHTQSPMLVTNQWANQMFMTKDIISVNPLEQNITEFSKDMKLIHYLIPMLNDRIVRAGNLFDFVETENKEGYLEQYPCIKFIYAHGTNITVAPELSRQGGRLIIQMDQIMSIPEGKTIDDCVTYSADQVAFYKTVLKEDGKTIYSYFKRGLMPNEAYGQPSQMEVNFECLSIKEDFTATIQLEEVKYDVTLKEQDYEAYFPRDLQPSKYTFKYKPYLSLPALEIATRLFREGNTIMREYELMSPFSRYGVYQQELLTHSTIYTYPETHNVKDPGYVTKSGGLATVSNIGISSIPAREFVTHGGLLIPAGARTSRVEWFDIWGRQWEQPMRSLFPDIPPIPPPLKNFVMSTTFELTDNKGERLLEWPSDEDAYIHVQLKFLNNYPKFFLPITCPANGHPYAKFGPYTYSKDRMFTYDDIPQSKIHKDMEEYSSKNIAVDFGFRSVYGKCYTDQGSMLSGKVLEQSDFDSMEYAMTCSATANAASIKKCEDDLKDVKTLSRRPSDNTDDTDYNYSPSIKEFYPDNYIKRNMWDLTHYDYDDNAMDKGYRYHCGNNLPSIDVCPPQNPAYYKPHNTVTFPLFKGFGYSMTYTQDLSLPKESQKVWGVHKGWWSDNLQNKDNTLLAGQSYSNDVSVGKQPLLTDKDWVNVNDLNEATNAFLEKVNMSNKKDWIKRRLKNIYVCEFNQHRLRVSANQRIYAFPENVLQNNVVPIHPDLKDEDERLTNFNCTGKYQYSPNNISMVDNRVYTVTDRDWLYFAINLRGGARENIHIPMKLEYFRDRKYEGITKVQDGGRFVYWNPVNGPNSFLNVENPVNVIEAYRVDIEVEEIVYPNEIETFNGELYKIFTIKDENEINRQYTQTTYTNSYGFGDSTITTFVGGTLGSVCSINEGETTYIRITFYNNCGFDWNLKGTAIDFDDRGQLTISANDLLTGKKHAIQAPLDYKFMTLQVPEDLKDCLEIKPSDHNIDTAPQFFDFENINVATIRDGFEGNYYYKLTVKSELPKKYWGKLVEIPITLNEEYFDRLPNINDETKIHNYTLIIPPIKFGFPMPNGEHKGKVFVTYGRTDDYYITQINSKYLNVTGAKFITEEDEQEINSYTFDKETVIEKINKYYENLNETVDFTNTVDSNGKPVTNYKFNASKYRIFPTEQEGAPDIAKFRFLVKYSSHHIPYGYQTTDEKTYIHWNTMKRNKAHSFRMNNPWQGSVSGKGAYAQVSYAHNLVAKDINGTYQKLPEEYQKAISPSESGTIQVKLTIKNVGNKPSYYNSFGVVISPDVSLVDSTRKPEYKYQFIKRESDTYLQVDTNKTIGQGESYSDYFYFTYDALIKDTENQTRRLEDLPNKLTVIKEVSAIMDLNENKGSNRVVQPLENLLTLSYAQETTTRTGQVSLSVSVVSEGDYTNPTFTVTAKITAENQEDILELCYVYYRKIETENDIGLNEFNKISDSCTRETSIKDSPFKDSDDLIEDTNSYTVKYKVEAYKNSESIRYKESSNSIVMARPPSETPKSENKASTSEEKKSKKWVIALCVISGFVLLSAVVSLIVYFYTRKGISSVVQASNKIEVEAEAENYRTANIEMTRNKMRKNINQNNSMVPISKDILKMKENNVINI